MSDPFVDEFHSRDLGELSSDLGVPNKICSLPQFFRFRHLGKGSCRLELRIAPISVSDPLKPFFSAVKDFRDKTERTLHVMRDNPNHGAIVLGGMFGARMPSLGAGDPRKV